MKNLRTNLLVAALCCFALAGSALANDHKAHGKNKQKTVTLSQDLLVNDQLIERGTYQFKFDAANTLVTIWRGGERVTSAKVNVKMGDKKASYNSLTTTATPKGAVLTGITFEGDKRLLTFEGPNNAVAEGPSPNN